MESDWKNYACQIGEHAALVMVDVARANSIREAPVSHLLLIRMPYSDALPNGFPSTSSLTILDAFGAALDEFAQLHELLYVGRVTTAGSRTYYLFTNEESNEVWFDRFAFFDERSEFSFDFSLEPDPERAGYFESLYPTADDWQAIRDWDVVMVAHQHGDDGSRTRPITHLAYFFLDSAVASFRTWVEAQGYRTGSIQPTDDGRVAIEFEHDGTLDLDEVSRHSIPLRRTAEELGGEYDGWFTPICAE